MILFNADFKLFSSSLLNGNNYFSGFSTSAQGDSLNLVMIENFFNKNNLLADKIVVLRQIHSVNIIDFSDKLNSDRLQIIEETDGIVTNQSRCALVVRTADCVPLLISDNTKGVIGASHQGWRGSLKNMAEKMIRVFAAKGSNLSELKCAIGPAIGACCYEVSDDHYYEFLSEYEDYAKQIFLRKKGRWHISLNHLNYLQLIRAGVKKENIDFFPFCTKCNSERFFSRRRSGSGNFGEMFSFIMKK